MRVWSNIIGSMGVTILSLILFGVVSSVYQLATIFVIGILDQEHILFALRDALFVTIVIFGAWFYFIYQAVILSIGRFQRLLLFFVPLAMVIAVNCFFMYRSSVLIVDQDLFEDIIRYLPYTAPSMLFIFLNNALIVRRCNPRKSEGGTPEPTG